MLTNVRKYWLPHLEGEVYISLPGSAPTQSFCMHATFSAFNRFLVEMPNHPLNNHSITTKKIKASERGQEKNANEKLGKGSGWRQKAGRQVSEEGEWEMKTIPRGWGAGSGREVDPSWPEHLRSQRPLPPSTTPDLPNSAGSSQLALLSTLDHFTSYFITK